MTLPHAHIPDRLARRRRLLLAVAVVAGAILSTAPSTLARSLFRDARTAVPWQSDVASVVTAVAVAVTVLALWSVLRIAGRAAWAAPVGVLAAAAPVAARAAEEASWVVTGWHGADASSVPHLLSQPGVTGVVAVLTAQWLWPTPFPPAARRTVLLLLAGWAVVTGVDAGLGMDSRLWVVDPYATIGVALAVTAGLVATTDAPAALRWRRALLPAAPVTVLVLLPDMLVGVLYGHWLPYWTTDQTWRPAAPLACAFAGLAAGVLLTARPHAGRLVA